MVEPGGGGCEGCSICKSSQKYEFGEERSDEYDESFYLVVGNMLEVEWQQGQSQSHAKSSISPPLA